MDKHSMYELLKGLDNTNTNTNQTIILEDRRTKKPVRSPKISRDDSSDPIVYDSGDKIDANTFFVDSGSITDGMRYISKMTSGIATGVLSEDPEYIKLQKKFVDMIIRDKVEEVKKEVEENLKNSESIYKNARKCQKESLEGFRESLAKVTEENGIHIYMNPSGECVAVSYLEDIESIGGGGWKKVSCRDLKDIRDAKAKVAKKKVAKKKAKKKSDR